MTTSYAFQTWPDPPQREHVRSPEPAHDEHRTWPLPLQLEQVRDPLPEPTFPVPPQVLQR